MGYLDNKSKLHNFPFFKFSIYSKSIVVLKIKKKIQKPYNSPIRGDVCKVKDVEKVKLTRKTAGTCIISILITLLIGLIILSTMQPILYANPSLNLTVMTDKQTYGGGEKVHINGTLTSNGSPINDAIVAIEVRDRAGLPFTFRTRPTGIITTADWSVNYTELFPCDSTGNPKYSFKTGTNLWIRFTVKNYDDVSHSILTAISVYDVDDVPFGAWYPYSSSIDPGKNVTVVFMADRIPSSAKLGDATIYANIYSDFPKNEGVPYCLEKSATFTITSTLTSSTASFMGETYITFAEATYNLTFKLPSIEIRIGNYTVYVSSQYQSEKTTNTTTFQAILVGDVDGNLIVDMTDIGLVAMAYGSSEGDPPYEPRLDINSDGIVDMTDLGMVAQNYGNTAI